MPLIAKAALAVFLVASIPSASPGAECSGLLPPTVEPPGGVTVGLRTVKATVAQREPVPLLLEVRNDSLQPVVYSRPSSFHYDFWVRDAAGTLVWWHGFLNNSPGDSHERDTLGPGEREVVAELWLQTGCTRDLTPTGVAAGRYTAQAAWEVRGGGWHSNVIEFEILATPA